MEIASAIGLIAFVAVALLYWRSYLPAYFHEKAKNLATKEDVQQITEAVESVKNKFEQDNERLRHSLERSNHVTKFQFEKEYDLYREMWASLVDLKRTSLSLRPVMDFIDPKESAEERKKNRLNKFADAYEKTVDVAEKSRPFYPAAIWLELRKLLDIAHKEAVGYRHQDEGRNWEKYWGDAQAAQKAILEQIDVVSVAMRDRLETFRNP